MIILQLRGIHFLLTYKCNARCRHCFLNAGPEHSAVLSEDLGSSIIDEAARTPSINHLFIEGGEPFLFPKLMLSLVGRASESGLWIGALTNAFWAATEVKALAVLKPLVDAGLGSLSISTDAWHEEFVPLERVETAARACQKLGLEVDIMVCGGPAGGSRNSSPFERRLPDLPVHTGGVVCRGRASSALCANGSELWQQLTACPESLASPGRVHLGPGGEVHLCQGLLIGETARDRSLGEIFGAYNPEKHPIVNRLIEGGPAGLAALARKFGWQPSDRYVDGCQLCYEARVFLRSRYPDFIGPGEIFLAA